MKKVILGVDIGGTNTVFGLVDKDGQIYAEQSLKTGDYDNPKVLIKDIHTEVNMLLTKNNELSLIGIGVGAPNGNYYKGTIEDAANLSWTGIIPMADYFKQQFNKNTILTNDANAAAVGEMIYGGAKNINDFIVITLGTGLGSGIVINGQLLYGHDGFAGELGHTTAINNGRKCGCGRLGCLETYASASGIVYTAKKMLAESKKVSVLKSLKQVTSVSISKAAINEDILALEIFDYTAKVLANSLADAVAFSSPKAIFLFGGLAKSGDLLLTPLKKYFEEALLPIYRDKVDIKLSELMDKNAAILGAAALAWNNIR